MVPTLRVRIKATSTLAKTERTTMAESHTRHDGHFLVQC